MTRPETCIDKKCEFVYSSFDKERDDINKGFSYFCYGILPKGHIGADFKYKEAHHINDVSHCIYTPLKGIIRFFVNKDDLWIETLGTAMIMDKVYPLGKCTKCGKDIKRFNELSYCVGTRDGKFCKPCYFDYDDGKT